MLCRMCWTSVDIIEPEPMWGRHIAKGRGIRNSGPRIGESIPSPDVRCLSFLLFTGIVMLNALLAYL